MNHKEKLLEIYEHSFTTKELEIVDEIIKKQIALIGEKLTSQKGVYTVLVTLVTHKILKPKQDIRYHQSSMENGFSGRTVDTKYITPTLKELGFPPMAESGWLTRSLEQPYPYTLDYNGKISNKTVKNAFLLIIDYIQNHTQHAAIVLKLLLNEGIKVKERLKVKIIPLKYPEKITIESTINALTKHFTKNYQTSGGAKLPVLAFYAIYEVLIKEMKRYIGCELGVLGSHTASDRTGKSSGDIELFKERQHFEAIEIKLDKKIDATIVRIGIEKVCKFNLQRYYILSNVGIKKDELANIKQLIEDTREKHGCQIIVNGVIPSLKYYLRLIEQPSHFIQKYSVLVERDKELKTIHKSEWNKIIHNFLS